ncbi:hypothetical protein N0V90_002485 [Kalmusia sp. IMI 367209]|nr:hypothetical protein N0V90_002485 [Kalmusia sp. IMI 367209]
MSSCNTTLAVVNHVEVSNQDTAKTNHTNILDDEITALALQLEEVEPHGIHGRGKFPAGEPPDSVVAFNSFYNEIEAHLSFLRDARLAHSIAFAVNADADAIAELAGSEEQAHDDREYALQLNGAPEDDYYDDDEWDAAGPSTGSSTFVPRWLTATAASARAIDVPESSAEAEQPYTYTGRQADALEKLSQEFECSICFETYHASSILALDCGDRYCLDCLKNLFLRAKRDETLYPPRCCRQPIAVELVANELTRAQLNAFRLAEMEFTTGDRTYCSNVNCGSFIPAPDIMADKAFCSQCGSETCAMCKSEFHQGVDCPADPALHATLSLADKEHWQRCYACGQLVELDHGCHHMTYVPVDIPWLVALS